MANVREPNVNADTVRRAGLAICLHGYNLNPANREDAEVLAYLALQAAGALNDGEVEAAYAEYDVWRDAHNDGLVS